MGWKIPGVRNNHVCPIATYKDLPKGVKVENSFQCNEHPEEGLAMDSKMTSIDR